MKNRIIILMLFLLLSISAVSADTLDDDLSLGDNQTLVETGSNQNIDETTGVSFGQVDQDTLAESIDDSLGATNDESLQKHDGNFRDLQTIINDAGSYVELSEDYKRVETDGNLIFIKAGNFTIEGNNHKIDANGLGPIFTENIPDHLILKNLVLMNANDNAINRNAITIINCTFFNNSATENGGAISTEICSLTVINSTFISNRAGSGGGAIYAFGDSKVLIDGCKFISNAANDGGALYFSSCPVALTNSTFTQNTAQSKGKAIFNKGNITLSNSSFSENGALGEYAIYNELYLSLNNNTVSNLIFNKRNITSFVTTVEPDNEIHKISSSTFTVNAFLKDDNGNNIYDERFAFTVNGLSQIQDFNATSGNYTLNYNLGGYGVAYVRIVNSMYNIDIPYGTYDYNYLGSFRDLQEKVNSAGDVLNLDYDFKFTDADRDLLSSEGVRINRNIVINANNHTIDADEKSRNFLIGSSYTLTLQNMKLNNGRSNEGGSIHCVGNLVLINCTFNNNNRCWDSKGDVIFSTGDLSCYNCQFSSKRELYSDGGALYLAGTGKTIIIENTKFISFVSSIRSGGVIFNNLNDLKIRNCEFSGCSALSYGGAIYSWGDVQIKGTVFDNCGNVIYNGGDWITKNIWE